MSVDVKLRERLFQELMRYCADYEDKDSIDRIIEIFEEEGYIKEIDVSIPAITPYNPKPKYMTGQEWYERFLEEWKRSPESGRYGDDHNWAIYETAKRASGIVGEEE